MARLNAARFLGFVSCLGIIALVAGGCGRSQTSTAAMSDVPPPLDDAGRPMGPMPLAVSDRVGRQVFMNRSALVARGLVRDENTFADGSMSGASGDE